MTRSSDPDWIVPGALARLGEFAGVLPRLVRSFGHLGPRGPEDGRPALVIPGFLGDDRTTMTLRREMAARGWRVHPWGMGMNLGARADLLDRIDAVMDEVARPGPAVLVGWSLGGIYAREYARHRPERVRAVVTLGSPFSGDPRANNMWRVYEWLNDHKVDDPPIARIEDKPPVPHLALWSRRDGIVAPGAAHGRPEQCDCAVELGCSHMAFAVSRRAARRVTIEIDKFMGEAG